MRKITSQSHQIHQIFSHQNLVASSPAPSLDLCQGVNILWWYVFAGWAWNVSDIEGPPGRVPVPRLWPGGDMKQRCGGHRKWCCPTLDRLDKLHENMYMNEQTIWWDEVWVNMRIIPSWSTNTLPQVVTTCWKLKLALPNKNNMVTVNVLLVHGIFSSLP